MQKADFEKNVQEKMQELRFRPSDEVWKRVEAGIDGKGRPAIMWIMFAAAIVLVVVGYFVVVSPKNKYADKSNQPGQSIANKKVSSQQTVANKTAHAPLTSAKETNSSLELNNTPIEKSSSVPHVAQSTKNTISKNAFNHTRKNPKQVRESNVQNVTQDYQIANGYSSETINPVSELNYSMPIQHYGWAIPIAHEHKVPSKNKLSSISTAKNSWECGISFSTGLSNLGNRLLISDSLRQTYSSPWFSTTSVKSGTKNGLAFSIGGTVSKWIGSKLKLGLGLQYQYLSNSIKVGDKIDSAMFLSTNNNVNVLSVSGYYKSYGDKTYHNQYHFISLPVILNWQFASKFSWENQVVYSRLIATNGLHFDALNGAYYKDRELFNNNQFMIVTAVMYGFNKNKFEVGPQLQYAFTNLMSNGEPKSLRSVGIKANMRFSKN